jgi:hypothetical protein
MNATEIGSALSAQHGGMSRRGHSRFARNKTRDTNLVCCAHQASLDTAALGVPHRLDGALHLDGRQLGDPMKSLRANAWLQGRLQAPT